MAPSLKITSAIVAAAVCLPFGAQAASDEGPIGKVSQAIVAGDPVTPERQKELGLVTVGGGCSGTLLNRYWVLTADHCVSINPKVWGSADAPFASKPVSASWSAKIVTPTRYVRYWNSDALDVALIFLGDGDFGDVPVKLLFHQIAERGQVLAKFGQGICAFASGSGVKAKAAQTNCGYRTALFEASAADDTTVVLPKNKSGQVGNGGDSGGPDYQTDGFGKPISIVSVQSTCVASGHVSGKPAEWDWVTDISDCSSAALYTIRDEIMAHVLNETPLTRTATTPAGNVADALPNRPKRVLAPDTPIAPPDVTASRLQDLGGIALTNAVYGLIGDKYAKLGGPTGPLGAVKSSESDAPHGGRFSRFEHGAIFWHPEIGEAFGVWGLIDEKWSQLGEAQFGYPITDETATPDGRGRFNHFRAMHLGDRPESSIYWTPQTGAHAVYGEIRKAWAQQGWERGALGYPTSDEYQDGNFRRVDFERGYIRWAPNSGIEIVH